MKLLFSFFVTLFFIGCSIAPLDIKETKVVLIKSPKIKYQDIAYLQHNNDSIQLQLYNAGVGVGKIEIGYMVCTNDGCITKTKFNKEFLSPYYPDDLLKNILLSQPIFDGKNLHKTSQGFIQKIFSQNYAITYKVQKGDTFFKDRKNNIIIRLKDLK